MKTRDAIYSQEAAELLRAVTTYKSLAAAQLYRLFPGNETKTQTILAHLIRQGRVLYDQDSEIVSASPEHSNAPDAGMIAAFWVLLDFIDKSEYHTASDFPVKISFFADGEMYEIISVPAGHEALVCNALAAADDGDPPRRLILIDNPAQAAEINMANVAGFCTVSPDGAIVYYKRQ
jgi:hypothetical protein